MNRAALRQAAIVVVVFVLVGLACGWLWHQVWSPAPEGFVYLEQPRFEDDVAFRGTGLYLMIAGIAGLLLGLIVTWLFEVDELITLGALVVGSLAAGWVMHWFGGFLGPESVTEAARGAEDFTRVEGSLDAGRLVPWVAFPGGALHGAFVILVCFHSRAQTARLRASEVSEVGEDERSEQSPLG